MVAAAGSGELMRSVALVMLFLFLFFLNILELIFFLLI